MGADSHEDYIGDPRYSFSPRQIACGGVALRHYVSEAVDEKLKADGSDQKPWMKHVGKLKRLRKETRRINSIIESTFEQIDPEVWH